MILQSGLAHKVLPPVPVAPVAKPVEHPLHLVEPHRAAFHQNVKDIHLVLALNEAHRIVKARFFKFHALMFDQFQNGYYATGEKVGQAWNAGKEWMKK